MTYDLKLNDAGDLDLDASGRATLIGGAAQIAQQVRLTLLIFLGEWFLDTTFGMPYFQSILGKGRSVYEIEAIVRQRVRAVPGVQMVGVINAKVDPVLRRLSVVIQDIATDEGRISEVKISEGLEL